MPGPPHPCLSLSAYVDGRLPSWRRAVVERHLVGCTRCALEVAQIRALRVFLASPAAPEVPPGLQDRLLGIARADERPDPASGPASGPGSVRGLTQGPEQGSEQGPEHDAAQRSAQDPADAPGTDRASPRPLVGAVGVMAACLVVLGAAGAGALVTGVTTPAPGTPPRASLTTVLPRLLSWPVDPGAAATVRPVDNGDRP
ncbi:anti-sigma factor family protein [Aquipuribacter sp. MA13-6]|uniref:anti-sigma factor family protein n=1 Tax=unclassified Aquipuribacter TaxID=2635084 RepID=UPI003EEDDA05